jgi:hypothetical protein
MGIFQWRVFQSLGEGILPTSPLILRRKLREGVMSVIGLDDETVLSVSPSMMRVQLHVVIQIF